MTIDIEICDGAKGGIKREGDKMIPKMICRSI